MPKKPAILSSPAPSIEDPVELLLACHDKVRHFSALAPRLRDHLRQAQGVVDAQAREAAMAILRYFRIAAPLHHQDEEDDLFPALRQAVAAVELHEAMSQLQAEHTELEGLWQRLTPWLEAISQGQPHAEPDVVDEFAQRQAQHAHREETQVLPFARQLDAHQIKVISAAMVKRRTQA